MEQEYGAIHNFDLAPVTATVQKAETDWPDKARNLEKRLGELRDAVAQTDAAWQSSAEGRRLAAANRFAHADLAALVAADNTLKTEADGLPVEVTKLEKHASQLYNSWDKILVDMADRGGGQYDQEIRTIQTHFADASAKTGDVSSDEKWVHVSQADFDAEKNNLGMAIEHKPRPRCTEVRSRTRGAARGLCVCGAAHTAVQPIRLLGSSGWPRFLGLLRPVRAHARSAVESPIPAARSLRVGGLPDLL